MHRRRPPLTSTARLLSLVAAAAVVVTVLLGTSAPAQVVQARGTSGAVTAARSGTFGIRVGSATGLHPGGEVTVPVRYTNPFSHTLVVRSQDVQVTSPSSACPATSVDLTRARTVLARALAVPTREARTVEIVLSMRASAPDGCQGARLTVTITAQGRKR